MEKLWKKVKNEEGFTLIEMSIVLIVIALLLILIVPNVTNVMDGVYETTDQAIIKTVDTQTQLYKSNNKSSGDVDLGELVANGYITEKQLTEYNAAITRSEAK